MIDKKTVFILGAGASMPYNYPSGYELRTIIYNNFNSNYRRYLETQADFSQRDLFLDEYIRIVKKEDPKDFANQFRDSNISIDLFLSLNNRYEDVGKKAIALSMLLREGVSQLDDSSVPEKDNWYKYLLNKIAGDLTQKEDYKNIGKNKITIITFNYDRSLEHFLYASLSSMFGEVDTAEIIKQLKKIRIIHIYGQVAKLKWQDSENFLEYLNNKSEDDILTSINLENIAKNIKVIYEEREASELKEVQQLIKEAERIFFLGFGYAKENLEILDFSGLVNYKQQIYGTALDMSENEILHVKNKLIPKSLRKKLSIATDAMLIENMDCMNLLKNYC